MYTAALQQALQDYCPWGARIYYIDCHGELSPKVTSERDTAVPIKAYATPFTCREKSPWVTMTKTLLCAGTACELNSLKLWNKLIRWPHQKGWVLQFESMQISRPQYLINPFTCTLFDNHFKEMAHETFLYCVQFLRVCMPPVSVCALACSCAALNGELLTTFSIAGLLVLLAG